MNQKQYAAMKARFAELAAFEAEDATMKAMEAEDLEEVELARYERELEGSE